MGQRLPEPVAKLPQPPEERPGLLGRGHQGGHPHQASDPQPGEPRGLRHETLRVLRQDPVLLGLLGDIYLDEDIGRRVGRAGPLADLLSQAERVHRVDHREQPERLLDLVALEAADEVPDGPRHLRGFGPRLLHPVLAEDPQPAGHGLADPVDPDGFGHRHQQHAFGPAPAPPRGLGDPGADPSDVGPDLRHERGRLYSTGGRSCPCPRRARQDVSTGGDRCRLPCVR